MRVTTNPWTVRLSERESNTWREHSSPPNQVYKDAFQTALNLAKKYNCKVEIRDYKGEFLQHVLPDMEGVVDCSELKLVLSVRADSTEDLVTMVREAAKKEIKKGELRGGLEGCAGGYEFEIARRSDYVEEMTRNNR